MVQYAIFKDIEELSELLTEYTVNDLGCWVWIGHKNEKGYGKIRYKGKVLMAHRVSLVNKLKRELLRGECACHRCDNPSCINPDHLWAGTRLQNNRDAIKKGRFVFNVKKDACRKGHEMNDENVYLYSHGGYIHRKCVRCRNERMNAYYRKKKAA